MKVTEKRREDPNKIRYETGDINMGTSKVKESLYMMRNNYLPTNLIN